LTGAAVTVSGGDEMAARLAESEEHGGGSVHAGGADETVIGILKRADSALGGESGVIAITSVLERGV
jgi:hypothetical protein